MTKSSRSQKIQQMFEGFMSLQKALGTRKDSFFKQYRLTKPQMHILYSISQCGNLTVKDIASKMGITSSAATQMIEGLVDEKFIERTHDNNDRRIVHVAFSTPGKKRFEAFKKAHIERVARTFEVLSDKELDALITIPKKVLEKLETSDHNS